MNELLTAATLFLSVLCLIKIVHVNQLLRAALPYDTSPERIAKLKCPVCGVVDSRYAFMGMMLDLNLNGGDAHKCSVCNSITIDDKEWLASVSNLANFPYMLKVVTRIIRGHIVDAHSKYELSKDEVSNMLNWVSDIEHDKDGVATKYIEDVVKRTKARSDCNITSRLSSVIADDFHGTFLSNKISREAQAQIAYHAIIDSLETNRVPKE